MQVENLQDENRNLLLQVGETEQIKDENKNLLAQLANLAMAQSKSTDG